MILGLKRRIISRFLQSSKLKPDEIQNIQRYLEDGTSFCHTERNMRNTFNGKVLLFRPDFLKNTSQKHIDLMQSVTPNNEVSKSPSNIFFHEAPNVLAKAVLTDIYEQAENYGKNQVIEFNQYFNGKSFVDIPKNENVVVQLSNQHIAEPFSFAHLRTIMIGRFITNISKLFNKNVTFVNFFYDWTQMIDGMIERRNDVYHKYEEEEMNVLADAFEEINMWSLEGPKEQFFYKVTFMNNLEQGDQKALETWQKCRDMCVNNHEKMYQRLGIKFDVTTAESQYNLKQIISMAKEKNLLEVNEETGKHTIDLTYRTDAAPIRMRLVNKQGLLYLIRNIASLFDEFNKYSADRIIYLTNTPRSHFYFIQRIMKKLRYGQPGRIELATSHVYLEKPSDTSVCPIMDEMWNREAFMLKHFLCDDHESSFEVAEMLTISRFAVQLLKNKRCKIDLSTYFRDSYGDTESEDLQYTHARLCRMIKLYNDDYSFKSVDFNLLSEDCAIRLIQHLARYHEVLIKSYMELESCYLVHYLITLTKLERRASKQLSVFNQPKEIRDARFTLFKCTRQVLANGMNILDIPPIGKI